MTAAPDWNRFRAEMPVARHWTYLDHAAVGPLSSPAAQAMIAWAEDLQSRGDVGWLEWDQQVEQARAAAASMVSARPQEIAFIPNTTAGVSLVAEGFPWQPGDNVLVFAEDFPSNVLPWKNLQSRGVEVRTVPTRDGAFRLEDVEQLCDGRTRIIAVSWVGYATGWRCDLNALAELAHAGGALLFVDAIQGLGVQPLNVQETPIDFFAADGHKWLLGPEGAGLCYIRHQHLDLLRPLNVGWNSVQSRADFTQTNPRLKDAAARYEGGSLNVPGILALGASLNLLISFGVQQIATQIETLHAAARDRLQAANITIGSSPDPNYRTGIVAFDWPQEPLSAARKRCLDASIALSARAGRLRIALHAYNHPEEIDRLVEVLTSPR